MVKKNGARRRVRAHDYPASAPAEDVFNPTAAIVSLTRQDAVKIEPFACVVTALETAPSRWRQMGSAFAQGVVLYSGGGVVPRLAMLAPFNVPCQVLQATVNKPHAYLPRRFLQGSSTLGTVEWLSRPPELALIVHAVALDDHASQSHRQLQAIALKEMISNGLYIVNQQVVNVNVLGAVSAFRLCVSDCVEEAVNVVYRLTSCTDVIMSGEDTATASLPVVPANDAIGGLDRELAAALDFASLRLQRAHLLTQMGISGSCRGLLLYGPPGTGKSLMARHMARLLGAKMFTINGGDCVSSVMGASEKALRAVFAQAIAQAPSIVFCDEVDALCPRPSAQMQDTDAALHARLGFTLMSLFDSLVDSSRVLVIAATNRPDSVNPALRRPGRFDREIPIGVPSAADRLAILTVLLEGIDIEHTIADDDVAFVAANTHGFVGADLRVLLQEAVLASLRRPAASSPLSGVDLRAALNVVGPSALRETVVEVPKVRWADIGGQEAAKAVLREVVDWPLRHPEAFARLGIRPPRGVLLYGPPGCSKTMMARALATESNLNFIAVKGPELLSKWVGDSEKALRDVFAKARASAPTIVFFDEIDSIACARSGMGGGASGGSAVGDRVLSQLLSELDGIQAVKSVIVVAATNRPASLDPALMRPGRIDRLCYIAMPDADGRAQVVRIHCAKYAVRQPCDIDFDDFVAKTEGFSGAEIGHICREAAMKAMEEQYEQLGVSFGIAQVHVDAALREAKPRVTRDVIDYFESFARQSI